MLKHAIRYTTCEQRTTVAHGDYFAFEVHYTVEGIERNCLDNGVGPTPLEAAEDAFKWMRRSLTQEEDARKSGSTYLGDPKAL